MSLTKKQIRKDLKITLKDAITNFFAGKEVTAFHPLDLIFPRERRIRSLIGGLETSLGTQVWEPVAKTLARNNGFTILDEKEFNASVPDIPVDVMHKLSDFENRKLKDQELLCCDYFTDIKGFINEANIVSVDLIKIPKGEGVDLWLKKDGKQYLIDIKTTQVNAGSGPKFLKNLLKWYTYIALKDVNDAKCMIGFPFNPHKKDFWIKEGGKIAPLLKNKEADVADDFWDMLSGFSNTTDLIFETFRELGEENFGAEFEEIFLGK